jgi:hypothetical protein
MFAQTQQTYVVTVFNVWLILNPLALFIVVTSAAARVKSSLRFVTIAVVQRLWTTPHNIPLTSCLVCRKDTKSSLKAKETKAPSGKREMSSSKSGVKSKQAISGEKRLVSTGRKLLALMRSVVSLPAAENLADPHISSQALLGFERNITHLDGHEVHVLRKGVTQPGK